MAKTLLKELVFKKTTKAEIESGALPNGKFYIPTDDTVAFMSDLETKQDKGDYATNTALTQGLATKQPVGNYATEEELAQGLATKQPVGNYATEEELTQGLAGKQPVGNYATEEELTQGLSDKADKATTLAGYGITDGAKTDLSNVSSDIDYVVESQAPTAENGYTWYRKYKSGWVEQGGTWDNWDPVNASDGKSSTKNLAIKMSDTQYLATISLNCVGPSYAGLSVAITRKVSSVELYVWNFQVTGNYTSTGYITWYVCGISAQGA